MSTVKRTMSEETPVDVLSEVLRVVRLSGAVHLKADFTEPWAIMSSPPEMLATRLLRPGAESLTLFHIFAEGSCWVSSATIRPFRFQKGDVMIVPRGDQHVMASDPAVRPVPIREIFPNPSADETKRLEHGGGGFRTEIICGYLHADQRFNPLLDALPVMLGVRQRLGAVTLESVNSDG